MKRKAFIEAFESCRLTQEQFRHADHVKLAWAYLCEYPLPETMIKLREGLKRFADHLGAAGLYHETITFSYAALIAERMRRTPGGRDWSRFCRQNPDLFQFKGGPLGSYYQKETLDSDLARSIFILPDRIEQGLRA